MRRSSYFIQIFAFCIFLLNIRINLAQRAYGGTGVGPMGPPMDAIQKLFEAIEKLNKKMDALNERMNTMQTTLELKTTPDESKCLIRDVVDAINNQRFEIAEEKLIELGDDKKISTIVHDVYAGSVVNVDRIVNFAKALKNGESQFQVFATVLEEMVKGGNAEPIKLIKLVETFEREVARQNDESIKAKAKTVIDKAVEDIKAASVTVFQTAMIANKYQMNVEIDNLADALFNFKTEVSNEVMDRVVDSVFGVVAAGKILDNISSHKNIYQVIEGLTAIFNRFNYAGNLNNDATLSLASHLRKLQDRAQYKVLSRNLKDEVDKVVQRLPACARNLYFHTYVCLWNKAKQQYLYAASTSESHDGDRRNIFTWYPGDIPVGAFWNINQMGDAFYLKNSEHADEYLYSPLADFSFSKDQRYLFTWIPGNNTDPQSAWGIELDGDFCYIKTIFHNEYLYATDVRYNQLNSYVFTWKPGSLVRSPEFQWQIRNCGQIDARMDG
ncbi:uncharacterized protein LOC129919860 [Episyrphus balteatus]|uniref:uncharacterized protein LOC129919860 n=1 Tax=Episyrphus balteatus TaxID=286459 RepID=UPI0024859522|nr:uncharacterized protein LOC129919860 [Episyrphus balteatus]